VVAGTSGAVAGPGAGGAAGVRSCISSETWSRVSGPARYDMAHLVPNSRGWDSLVEWSTNCRLSRSEICLSISPMSMPPDADARPSRIRFLSFSVWRRPTIQVPALDIAL
jgi:hypothetical protein